MLREKNEQRVSLTSSEFYFFTSNCLNSSLSHGTIKTATYLQRLNGPANATPIAYGQTMTDSITLRAQMVAYIFEGMPKDQVLVRMTKLSGSLSPQIRVYRPDGTLACSNNDAIAAETLCTLTVSGTHAILASDFYGSGIGTYNLEIDTGWYVGRHSAAPIAFAAEGPIAIKVTNTFSNVAKIRADPTCLPHENHAFVYEPGLTLPIADGRFLALGVPLTIPTSLGHAHSMDIDGVFFDADGDGIREQGYGGFTFRSGSDVCATLWRAISAGTDSGTCQAFETSWVENLESN
jgi:hypothetical protein